MALSRSFRFAVAFVLVAGGSGLATGSASAQQDRGPAGGQQTDEDENPTPAPLTLGSMALASDAAVAIEAMAVDVGVERVIYSYRVRNKGKTKLNLAASVAMPDLEVNNEGTTVYVLPSQTPQNVVDLKVESNGLPIATTPHVEAVALGIDRLADLKAANIPLIPFGEAVEKALGDAKPEELAKLESLGLVTPRDPAQPDTPVIADWSLHVVHGWMQPLEPEKATNIAVSFRPIKAVYTIDSTSLGGFDALKEQVCLTPELMNQVKGLLKTKGATADVADITLANDGPARWLDNPPASVAVRKPAPDSIVAFCGVDSSTTGQSVVRGRMPGGAEAAGLRVLIFTRHGAR